MMLVVKREGNFREVVPAAVALMDPAVILEPAHPFHTKMEMADLVEGQFREFHVVSFIGAIARNAARDLSA
ncbi:MAG: hypothetical protein KGL35_11690, partial [Bradyrhizobium sp.]|nr:hypothetical protein [Bradyrhizobium sp.]